MPEPNNNWMLTTSEAEVVARRARALGITGTPDKAAHNLGLIVLGDGSTVRAHVVHAVDPIITDGRSVVMIDRVNPPGQGLPALPGGFIDPTRGGGVESAVRAAAREAMEEVGVRLAGGQPVGERNMYRPHDVRTAMADMPQYGIKKGDVFMVSTQGVRFDVPDLSRVALNAGSDAKPGSARAVPISSLSRERVGIPDHFDMISQATTAAGAIPKAAATPTTINHADIDFNSPHALSVTSTTQKFVIPVPNMPDAPPLVYPQGHEKAGQPILDWENKPIGDRGIVFANRAESIAAAPTNGQSVFIVNNVNAAQAQAIQEKINALGGDVSKLSHAQYQELLTHIRDNVGLTDIYNSDKGYVQGKMTKIGTEGPPGAGLHQKNADVHKAVWVDGPVEIHGSSQAAGGVQKFEKGALVVHDGKEIRAIDAEIAHQTYRTADGKPLPGQSGKPGGGPRAGGGYRALGIALPLIGASAVLGYASKASAKAGFDKTAEGLERGSSEANGAAGLFGFKIPEAGTTIRSVADTVYNAVNSVAPRGPEDIMRIARNVRDAVTGKEEPPAAKPADPVKGPKPSAPISH
jgi:hypothetical protein